MSAFYRKCEKWDRNEIKKRCYSESYENNCVFFSFLAVMKTIFWIQVNIFFELK